jgi:hypothetical protein
MRMGNGLENRHCEERSDEAIQQMTIATEAGDCKTLPLQQLRDHVANGTGLLRCCAPRNDGVFLI